MTLLINLWEYIDVNLLPLILSAIILIQFSEFRRIKDKLETIKIDIAKLQTEIKLHCKQDENY